MFFDKCHTGSIRDSPVVELHRLHHLQESHPSHFANDFNIADAAWKASRLHYKSRKAQTPMKRFALLRTLAQKAPGACAMLLLTTSLMIPAAMEAKTAKPVTLEESVRHHLAMMPRYGIFDNLVFQLDGGTVTLTGQVTRPVVKTDAADTVRRVEGVTNVVDNIEVLPLSPADDRLRMSVYRAIYGAPSLSARYGFTGSPAIHIIVKNGVVRLEGVVATTMDRNVAGIQAQGVFGAFKVENDLQVG